MIGTRALRVEDDRLLRGQGRFVDDREVAGALSMRVVRSWAAHGRLVGIDTGAAEALPGVVAVLTAKDVPPIRVPVRINLPHGDPEPFLQPILAVDRVRYVGEPVAVVLATSDYAAEDGAEAVELDIEPLAAVLSVADDSEVDLFPEGNVVERYTAAFGDIDAAFAAAAHCVGIDVAVGRHSAVPLECRGLVAHWLAGERRLDVWGGTKVPNWNRQTLARLLDLPPDGVHFLGGDAGGGFGVRGELYPEDVLACWATKAFGAPVRWIEDRAEHLVAANHSRQQRHRIEAAFDDAGILLGLRAVIEHDNGAYVRTHGTAVADLTVSMLPGPYRVPAYRADVVVGVTNKTPAGTYRAPGRFEGTFSREHLFDVAADRLGIDRIELRRQNLLTPADLPHERAVSAIGTPMVVDDAHFELVLSSTTAAVAEAGWDALADDIRRAGRLPGIGFAMFMEKSGFGPFEPGEVIVGPSGRVIARTGATSLGQGAETVVAQIVADELGVPLDDIRVELADTATVPLGGGSFASRSTVVGGSAVHLASVAVRDRIRRVASDLLEAAPDDLVLDGGRVSVAGSPTRGVALEAVALACAPGGSHFDPTSPGLSASHVFSIDHMTYPYGAHAALVAVDPATGGVEVVRYVVAYEVGRAVNPTMLEGQLVGGVAQGVGGALLEEFSYDENGQPLATSMLDYRLPTAHDVPPVHTIIHEDCPARTNPLGVKGGGEGGLTAAGAAIANAVRDAVGLAGAVPGLPLTPERVTTLLGERP